MPPYLTIPDNTPRAKERNNLTVKRAPVGLINHVIAESNRQGVDPYASLSVAMKETGFGTNRGVEKDKQTGKMVPRLPAYSIYVNPMQYNAHDRAPKVLKATPEQLKQMSEATWRDEVNRRIEEHPDFAALDDTANRSNPVDAKFADARIQNLSTGILQSSNIEGGVGYLKKVLTKHPNDLVGGFSRYRGGGSAADYHGRHVKELYDSLKKNQDIRGLVDTMRMGA